MSVEIWVTLGGSLAEDQDLATLVAPLASQQPFPGVTCSLNAQRAPRSVSLPPPWLFLVSLLLLLISPNQLLGSRVQPSCLFSCLPVIPGGLERSLAFNGIHKQAPYLQPAPLPEAQHSDIYLAAPPPIAT